MKTRSLRWLSVVCVLLALAVTSFAAPGASALAQPNKVTVTVDGFIAGIDDDGVQVAGEILELSGTVGDWEIGDWVVLDVIPAARFQNGRFEEGDQVVISGRLVGDGDTLRANRVQLLDEDDGDRDDEDDEDEDDEDGERANCPARESHPAAQKLAGEFDVSAEWVMGWFCKGFGFGEIKLALRVSEEAEDVSADELLALKSEGLGWGRIIQDMDMSPRDVNPGLGAGRPDDPGKPDGEVPPANPGRPNRPGKGQGKGPKK